MKTKTIILAVVIILIVGAIYYLQGTKVTPGANSDTTQPDLVQNQQDASQGTNPKDDLYERAPELAGIVGYLNTPEGTKISDFDGKVVLIDFWTYSCINCIRTLPYLTAWDEKYKDSGLVIIGVHTPEFEFEKDYDNVQDAIEKYGIEYPVVQDNDYATWKAYKNRYWPRKYLVDAEGYIRYDHIGEGGYEETEMQIQKLLAEAGQETNHQLEQEDNSIRLQTTPELYAGYGLAIPRGQHLGNELDFVPDSSLTYILPGELESDKIYLEGIWRSNEDNLELIGEEGSIFLKFKASELNIVAERNAEEVEAEIFIDESYLTQEQAGSDIVFDGSTSKIIVDSPQLYNLYDGEYGEYLLEIRAERGFKINSFTFGGQIN